MKISSNVFDSETQGYPCTAAVTREPWKNAAAVFSEPSPNRAVLRLRMAASLVLGMSFGPWHHDATSTEARILRTRRSSENCVCVTEQETREKMRRLYLEHTDIDIPYKPITKERWKLKRARKRRDVARITKNRRYNSFCKSLVL